MSMLFPAGIATGKAFCNRDHERALLHDNIKNQRHTVVVAPRRYGKTSLVSEVIRASGLINCQFDFLLSATPRAVELNVLNEVGRVLQVLMPKKKVLKEKILKLFHQLKPEITISAFGQKLVLHPVDTADRQTTIREVLLNLDEAAKIAKKRVIIFMDEFQQIGELRDEHTLEATFRHVVERCQNTNYIFSGSNRHLLRQMFSDKNRPFYRLCTLINLKRISQKDHISFIQYHAKTKWKKHFSEEAIETLIKITECHSYYINLICSYLWDKNQLPTKKIILSLWNEYILSQQSVISYDISFLSNNQKTLLKQVAKQPTNQPFSHEYLMKTQLTIASQKEALKKLMLKDFVYKDDFDLTRVLDPAVRSTINYIEYWS